MSRGNRSSWAIENNLNGIVLPVSAFCLPSGTSQVQAHIFCKCCITVKASILLSSCVSNTHLFSRICCTHLDFTCLGKIAKSECKPSFYYQAHQSQALQVFYLDGDTPADSSIQNKTVSQLKILCWTVYKAKWMPNTELSCVLWQKSGEKVVSCDCSFRSCYLLILSSITKMLLQEAQTTVSLHALHPNIFFPLFKGICTPKQCISASHPKNNSFEYK